MSDSTVTGLVINLFCDLFVAVMYAKIRVMLLGGRKWIEEGKIMRREPKFEGRD